LCRRKGLDTKNVTGEKKEENILPLNAQPRQSGKPRASARGKRDRRGRIGRGREEREKRGEGKKSQVQFRGRRVLPSSPRERGAPQEGKKEAMLPERGGGKGYLLCLRTHRFFLYGREKENQPKRCYLESCRMSSEGTSYYGLSSGGGNRSHHLSIRS